MKLEERFLKYVSFETTSDPKSQTHPSSPKEWDLAKYLRQELTDIGMSDVVLSDTCYVYAKLPASPGCEGLPHIGFIAHMDTSDAVSGANIKPSIIDYKGGDIQLASGVVTSFDKFRSLRHVIGHRLIVTDGTTLLGADDKAGIAEIVSAMEYLIAHPEIEHGQLSVCFTPDEEIGRGPDDFDLKLFDCEFAYTSDGARLGGVEYENFNAAEAKVNVKGVSIHPGSSKNRMKNAVLIANEFIGMLPSWDTPAHSEKHEGFIHVDEIEGDVSNVSLHMILRDFNRDKLEQRKDLLERITALLNSRYGEGTVTTQINDSYFNMKELILEKKYVFERAENALRALGIEPIISPVRGGTDGARLTYMGLPCPNLCTGGGNFHGVNEYVSIDAMEKCVELIVEIARAK